MLSQQIVTKGKCKMTFSAADASQKIREICALAPVVPVLVLDDVDSAIPLAEALVSGGLPVLEVTLRTPSALDVISAMAKVSGSVVGAGTLITPDDMKRAKEAGATFGVSPGFTPELVDACEMENLPLLAGVASVSEAMTLLSRGYNVAKFFPAETNGGAKALKAIGAPLPQISFCPTGGVSPSNAKDYLSLDYVMCVGGSWVAPADLVGEKNWGEIERLASDAAKLAV